MTGHTARNGLSGYRGDHFETRWLSQQLRGWWREPELTAAVPQCERITGGGYAVVKRLRFHNFSTSRVPQDRVAPARDFRCYALPRALASAGQKLNQLDEPGAVAASPVD